MPCDRICGWAWPPSRRGSRLLARPPWLESAAAGLGDDHVPFVERGVAVVHLIPMPFPSVWHTVKDDETAISIKVIADWERILSVFVWEYLAALK